ncbi:MAG: acyl carrier protein [Bacteroidales bacterium]|nr:acyl carrier protein [Bacteroidales bacterium]
MTKEELIKKVNAAIAEEFEVEESVLVPDASIKDTLVLDSLSLVDLVALIESLTGVKISGNELGQILTFSALYDYLYSRIG